MRRWNNVRLRVKKKMRITCGFIEAGERKSKHVLKRESILQVKTRRRGFDAKSEAEALSWRTKEHPNVTSKPDITTGERMLRSLDSPNVKQKALRKAKNE